MRKILIIAEVFMTIVCLFFYSGTPIDVFITDSFSRGSPVFPIMFTFSYFFSILCLSLRWKKTIYLLSRSKLTWLLVGAAALSAIWSIDPSTTTRRALGLIGTSLFGVYLANRYSLKEQLKLVALILGISAVFSFIYVLLIPSYGISFSADGGWKGIYITKNVLGKRSVLGGAICLLLALNSNKNWLFWLGYGIFISLLLLSGSKGALVNLAIITITCFILPILTWQIDIMIPTLTGLLNLITVFVFGTILSLSSFLASLGRDMTLTGRTPLWSMLGDIIISKPYLGYGYGVFWLGSEGEMVSTVQTWKIPNAHNGFVDICLSLGITGLLIFIADFFIHALRGISQVRMGQIFPGTCLLTYLTFIILSNLTETSLLEQNSIEWLLYVSTVSSSQVFARNGT